MADSWMDPITDFVVDVPEQFVAVKKKIALDLFSTIARTTRVDTGLARGNWQLGVGSPPSGPTTRTVTGTPPVPIGDLAACRPEDSIFIVNHVHYIVWLEHGTPRMAGDHMVANAVNAYQSYVADAIRST